MPEHHELAAAPQDEAWARIERIVESFEDAWRQGKRAALSDYLREGADLLPGLLVELIHAELEFRLQAGEATRVEEYLTRYPELADERQAVVDLLQTEWRMRARTEPQLSVQEYQQRFPALAQELAKVLCPVSFEREPDWPATLDTHKQQANPSSLSVSPPVAVDFDLRGYELNEQLGKGGMGEVYRCCDPALGRDLAIKVVKAEYCGFDEAERRFLREARVTGSLQHPGVVPVHNLGRLRDGRLHYTMRLVRGRTFAEILKEEAGKPESLPSLLEIFQKVCEAVAYAHSKRVIHRDLKPVNIMVGKFGEVQVMDWGLAKVLTPHGVPAEEESRLEAGGTLIHTEAVDTPPDLTQAGTAIGTPAFMSPEHAQGDWELVDERADVFSLGAILCEMLTGEPPYSGENSNEILRRAKRGDLREALSRLAQRGADAALTALCRDCLSPKREDRPRDADAVAERVRNYQAEVQARLRQAELERVAAETRAREERARAIVEQERTREALARVKAERRARQRTQALAAMVVLLLATGGGGLWWQQYQREQADLAVSNGLTQAEILSEQARADPLQTDKYHQALDAARIAARLAEGASRKARQQAEELVERLVQEEEAALRDRRLLAALLEARGPGRELRFHREDTGLMMLPRGSSAEEQFSPAFRDWGLDLEKTSIGEAVSRLIVRPSAVVLELVAALDEWTSELQRQGKPRAEWQRLADLAAALDKDSGSKRGALREILARGQLPVERALGTLSTMLRPVPVPVEVPLTADRIRLRQIVDQTDPATEPVLGLLTLVQALRIAGEDYLAERLLRGALQARPREVVIYHALAQFLATQRPPRWDEAVEFYRATRALRPELGVGLLDALLHSGRGLEGVALAKRLVRENPNDPYFLIALGATLLDTSDVDGAIACYKQAIDIDPKYTVAHYGLGNSLRYKRDLVGAISCYKSALEIDPNNVPALTNLGYALYDKADLDGALDCCKKAISLDSKNAYAYHLLGNILDAQKKYAEAEMAYLKTIEFEPAYVRAYTNIGNVLNNQGKHVEAETSCRKAIALKPDDPWAHCELGEALGGQEKHVEAEASFCKAIALKPDFAGAYLDLGMALGNQGKHVEAEMSFRKAIAHKPDYALAFCNLGHVLTAQGRFLESQAAFQRGHELGSKQSSWPYPSLQWVHNAERFIELHKQLPEILQGVISPANAFEAATLAWMCQQPYKKRYVASARLYADAFATDPKLAADLNRQHHYNAACSAALAATGQGEDGRSMPDKERARLRRQALGWLRDDLAAYTKLAEQNKPDENKMIQQRLTHWRRDPDLASVRDPSALDHLAEDERAAWHSLWRDVEKLSKRATNPSKDGQKPERREN